MEGGKGEIGKTYESVSFGFSGILIGDDNSFKNVAELLEMSSHNIGGCFPSKAPNKDFGKGGVTER